MSSRRSHGATHTRGSSCREGAQLAYLNGAVELADLLITDIENEAKRWDEHAEMLEGVLGV